MAELLAKLHELLALPKEIHWFCELYSSTDDGLEKDGADIRFQHSHLQDETRRRQQAIECLVLYSYDDAAKYQGAYSEALDAQLARCDYCIKEYYQAKHALVETLKHDYDEEQVQALEKTFDERDIARVTRGLERVERKLRAVEPKERTKDKLDTMEQLSLFEAMCNTKILEDDFLLSKHFQAPFSLVQTNSQLRLPGYLPAASIFLFDRHFERREWAKSAWKRFLSKGPKLTQEDFDFAIRETLLSRMQGALQSIDDPVDFEHLWYGIGVMISTMDNGLITHSLRALEVDIFRLALEHLRYEVPGFRHLVTTIRKLLELAPKDFWDAMGAISPTTFIEQIFNNAYFDTIMVHAKKEDEVSIQAMEDILSWINPFMSSLETAHQAGACRSFAFQLLDRLQADRFPSLAKVACYKVGMATLESTLGRCDSSGLAIKSTDRIVAVETVEITSIYAKTFLKFPSLPSTDPFNSECKELALKLSKDALSSECASLRADQETLKNGKELPYVPRESNDCPAPIWHAILAHMDGGNVQLAQAVLIVLKDMLGLEMFKVDEDDVERTSKRETFNTKLKRLIKIVSQILERINDFSAQDLSEVFAAEASVGALVSTLFSPDDDLYGAGVDLMKSISAEPARKEAIGYLLRTHFRATLKGFSWSIRQIAFYRSYVSCARMLKTSSDSLDVLCDSQGGLLRTRTLSSPEDVAALLEFWKNQWEALKVIYQSTEAWSRAKVARADIMKDFCRDTMQFSDFIFDQYSVFASAMESNIHEHRQQNSGDEGKRDLNIELLSRPRTIMDVMVAWLRLRDSFLVAVAVKLTNKIISRLTDVQVTVDPGPFRFLKEVVNSKREGKPTNLTKQEKAEVARALESNVGRGIVATINDSEPEVVDAKNKSAGVSVEKDRPGISKPKKVTMINLESWKNNAKRSQAPAEISDDELDDPETFDAYVQAASRSAGMMEDFKQRRKDASASANKVSDIKTLSSTRDKQAQDLRYAKLKQPSGQSDAAKASFREKREQERAEKKKRDAENIALIKKKALGPTAGEGSGIGGLGVKGKDHAPKGPSMMVSSGSESESDELDEELFGKASDGPQMSKSVQIHNASKAHAWANPVKKTKQIRSAKDMRSRLAPDLTQLHKTLLGWEFFHEGDFPPGSSRRDYSLVSNAFRTPIEYQNVFEPLLILEAWQIFLKSKDESNYKVFEVKIANRMNVDAFLEVSTTMSMAEGRELGIGEADIVLLSKGDSPAKDIDQPHCIGRVHKINRKSATMEVNYKVNVGNPLSASLVPNATLHAVKIDSITPLEREYGALLGLKYFDLCDEITKAKPSPLLPYTDQQLSTLIKIYDVNTAQAKAVKSAVDNDAFTLIQGPPGSGKTKTIVAIVGALLTTYLAGKSADAVAINRPRGNDHHPHQGTKAGNPTARKLLVCAPSNAAVDELVMRFKRGIKTSDGQDHKPNVVRLGKSDAINTNVRDVTLDELVNAKLGISNGKANSREDVQRIMMTHKATCEKLNLLRDEVDALKATGKTITPEQNRDLEVLRRQKQQLSKQIDAARDNGDTVARNAEINRRLVQQEILDTSHIICATLSGSGHDMFQNLNIEFETVVIDEAAQSIELSALIPLKYGCSKCILVGDPKQLPPTVLSREAARFQYEQSLFVRMQTNHPKDVHLLDTQYRMHPEISRFPSTTFYDSRLLDGPGMAKLRARPWHRTGILGPYRFFDVQGTQQTASRGHSLINMAEIEVAMSLYDRLVTDTRGFDFAGKIGIITPYKSQLKELRGRFAGRYGESILKAIEFNTTDAFQGRESEIIIFSCVRASTSKGIGFLSDIRRMNVGITRAMSSLWILGNSGSLINGEYWGRMLEDAKSRDCYTAGNLKAMFRDPLPIVTATEDIEMEDAWSSDSRTDQLEKTSHTQDSKSRVGMSSPHQEEKRRNISAKKDETAVMPREAAKTEATPSKDNTSYKAPPLTSQIGQKRPDSSSRPVEEKKALHNHTPPTAPSLSKRAASTKANDHGKIEEQAPAAQKPAIQHIKEKNGIDPSPQVDAHRPPQGPAASSIVKQPMPMKRKKEVDPFIRPKKRPVPR